MQGKGEMKRREEVGVLLAEVDELTDIFEWILVGALFGSVRYSIQMLTTSQCTTSSWRRTTQHIRNELRVAHFLISHELNQELVDIPNARRLKLLLRELRKPVVEEIQLDELLVEREVERLEVEVAEGFVDGRRVGRGDTDAA